MRWTFQPRGEYHTMFEQLQNHGASIAVSAGHWTDEEALTGCTVILFDRPAPAVVDVRGGAPGSRETALLGPGDLVQSVDAILLTGGSAFGLGAADGVMRFLHERGRGVATPAGPVPIVPTGVIYDLSNGAARWPTAVSGYAASQDAAPLLEMKRGLVGAGRGATTAKLGRLPPQRGGIGLGHCDLPGIGRVAAISVVNALGVVQTGGAINDPRPGLLNRPTSVSGRTATTLTVVLIDAPCDRRALSRAAAAAHDGMARVIVPCHTIFDGDIVFVVGLQAGESPPAENLAYSVAAELAVERAIVDAVQPFVPDPA